SVRSERRMPRRTIANTMQIARVGRMPQPTAIQMSTVPSYVTVAVDLPAHPPFSAGCAQPPGYGGCGGGRDRQTPGMTTIIRATDPAELLGAIPALAGFTPRRSVVLLPFRGGSTHGAMRV